MGPSEVAVFVALVVALGLVYVRVTELEKRLGRLLRLDAKLDALLEHAGIHFDPYGSLPREVVQSLESGSKIEAIKHYRRATGVGLAEAKEFVEEIQRRMDVID